MAFRGAISIGKHTNMCLLSLPRYLRATRDVSSSNACNKSSAFPYSQTGVKYPIRAVSGTAVDPVAPKKEKEEPSTENCGTAVDPVAPKKEKEEPSTENWKVKMLYDGECPLCMREVNMLLERNKSYGAIKFVDISSDTYRAEDNQGLDYRTAMGRIHAILCDGTVVTDVEAFRKLYEAVGLGWVYAITKYEPIASMADAIYGVWAKYRLPITGRPPLEQVLELRKKKDELCEDSKVCKM